MGSTFGRVAVGALGMGVGHMIGFPGLGSAIGLGLGSILFPPKNESKTRQVRGVLGTSSVEGIPVTIIYGKVRTGGNLIWKGDLVRNETVERQSGGGGKGGGSSTVVTDVWFTASFAIALGEGPLVLKKIYEGKNTVNPSFTFYNGSSTQEADPFLTQKTGKAIGYRFTSYIVFQDYNLGSTNNIPQLTFELDTGINSTTAHSIKDIITNVRYGGGFTKTVNSSTAIDDCINRNYFINFALTEKRSLSDILETISVHGLVSTIFSGSNIKLLVSKPDVASKTIDINKLLGKSGEQVIEVSESSKTERFNRLNIEFTDIEKEYSVRPTLVENLADQQLRGIQKSSLALPGFTDKATVQEVGYKMMFNSLYSRRILTFSLGPEFLDIEPGDICNLNAPTVGLSQMRSRVLAIDETEQFNLTVTAKEEPEYVYAYDVERMIPTAVTIVGNSTAISTLSTPFSEVITTTTSGGGESILKVKDSWLWEGIGEDIGNSDLNFGTDTLLRSESNTPSNPTLRPILGFNFDGINEIDENAIDNITSAKLEIFVGQSGVTNAAGDNVSVSRITQTDWTEAGVTWNKYDGVNNWSTGGGDFTESGIAITNIPKFSQNFFVEWDVTDQVLFARDFTNNDASFLLRSQYEGSEVTDITFFHSSEYNSDNFPSDPPTGITSRPKMTISTSIGLTFTIQRGVNDIIYIGSSSFDSLSAPEPSASAGLSNVVSFTITEIPKELMTSTNMVELGLYYGKRNLNAETVGVDMYMSTDNGTSFDLISESRHFTAVGELGSTVNKNNFIDTNDIILDTSSSPDSVFSSFSRTHMFSEKNSILIGDEYVLAQNAILGSSNTYTIQPSVRGRHGTQVKTHPVGTTVISLLNPDRFNIQKDKIGSTLLFKPVPINIFGNIRDISEVESISVKIEGFPFRPYTPGSLQSRKDGVDLGSVVNITDSPRDATISWKQVAKDSGFGRGPFGNLPYGFYSEDTDFTNSIVEIHKAPIPPLPLAAGLTASSGGDSDIRNGASADTNFGSLTSMRIFGSATTINRPIIKFDFSSLNTVAGLVITSAKLSIQTKSIIIGAGVILAANRITQPDWTEDGVTWNKYDGVNSWSTEGGDFTTSLGATTVLASAGVFNEWDVTDQVNFAKDNVDFVSHFLIKVSGVGETSSSTIVDLSPKEDSPESVRPKLEIEYTGLTDPVPSQLLRTVDVSTLDNFTYTEDFNIEDSGTFENNILFKVFSNNNLYGRSKYGNEKIINIT